MTKKEMTLLEKVYEAEIEGAMTRGPRLFQTKAVAVDLNSLTSIPEGFNPTVGGNLYLNSLTSIPEGFNPTVGGHLYLNSLTSIPEGFNPTVGGHLDLDSLTSIPEGFNPTVGGYLYLNSLTSIPEGFNQDDHQYQYQHLPFMSWQKGKHIKCDGRFSEVVSRKGNVWKLKDVTKDNRYFLVSDGHGRYAHGDTLQEAKDDLIYKIADRDPSEFKSIDPDEKLPFAKCIEMYRVITGACSAGTKHFIESHNIKRRKLSVRDVAKLTAGQYGSGDFTRFFGLKEV